MATLVVGALQVAAGSVPQSAAINTTRAKFEEENVCKVKFKFDKVFKALVKKEGIVQKAA